MISFGGLQLNSLDYVMIVNREFQIVYASRYDRNVSGSEKYELQDYIGKNFFQAYPSVSKDTSSIVRCMTVGEIVVKKFQRFIDFTGKFFCTHNVSIPLIRKGKIVGAIELIKDVTTVHNLDNQSFELMDEDINETTEFLGLQDEGISFEQILTQNDKMREAVERAKILAGLPNPTLIYGETGTGKELFAQAMINTSGISRKKVVVQNCAAVPENLIESILFGTTRGAYTGAETRKGLFEEADGGIFFLDELNSLPYHVQGKLLRVIQDGTFRSVGSNAEKKVKVKIIAAMNVDPMTAIEKKQLRSDLFYRLNSGMIYLPPLRERKDDIGYFINYYIDECNHLYNKDVKGLAVSLRNFFLDYSWNGNVRELKHTIESMISLSNEEILGVQQLPAYMYDKLYRSPEGTSQERRIDDTALVQVRLTQEDVSEGQFDLKKNLQKMERDLIHQVMKMTGGNKTKAADILGIPRQTLTYRMSKLGALKE